MTKAMDGVHGKAQQSVNCAGSQEQWASPAFETMNKLSLI
jgi:hypothetical protein